MTEKGINDVGLQTIELFAGAGGGVLGSLLAGHVPVCYVEREEYPQRVLRQRIADGLIPDAPIWDDVRTFDGSPWCGRVDVVSGGFPCQDISIAGKGEGIEGSKSSLWGDMARIVCQVKPRFVWVENSPALTSRGLGAVLRDLAALGYDAQWGVLGARDVGAPHRRDRIWILAHRQVGLYGWSASNGSRRVGMAEQCGMVDRDDLQTERRHGRCKTRRYRRSLSIPKGDSHSRETSDADKERRKKHGESISASQAHRPTGRRGSWSAEPQMDRVVDGLAHRVDRLAALGNGQVPAVVEEAWRQLIRRAKGF